MWVGLGNVFQMAKRLCKGVPSNGERTTAERQPQLLTTKDTRMLMRYTQLRAEDLVGRLGRRVRGTPDY